MIHDTNTISNADSFSDVLDALSAVEDGHVTLLRFTTGWKVVLGTPPGLHMHPALDQPERMTIEMAAAQALGIPPSFNAKYKRAGAKKKDKRSMGTGDGAQES